MDQSDVLIAGGGIVGLSLALALYQARPGALTVRLIETPERASDDRAFAIAYASKSFFESLGVWADIAPDAEPMLEMVITDSQVSDPVRPSLLTFEGTVAAGEPFAFMVPEQSMLAALRKAVAMTDIDVIEGQVSRHTPGPISAEARLSDGRRYRATLVVASDGKRSRLRDQAGIGWFTWPYHQSAITATIGIEHEHYGRAEEHFLPSGPFALLPLRGRRFAMVWTEATERAHTITALDHLSALDEIEKRMGLRYGEVSLLSPLASYPLAFGVARIFGADRLALVGDAAHVIHPIAGQGLNLGLADVPALVKAVRDQAALGLDIGSPLVIEAYDRARRFESVAMAGMTDVLNRLFSNDMLPMRVIRDFGLGLVNRMPTLKQRLIDHAAGLLPPNSHR
jgi:2-octaprenyl-6-methoxyphenol hydroxylase